MQHSKSCDWPEEDGRKVKRQRSRSLSQSSAKSSQGGADRFGALELNDQFAPPPLPILEEGSEHSFHNVEPPRGVPASRKDDSKNMSRGSSTDDSRRSSASDTPYTTVHYYRHHGPTAIAPGHKQISLKARDDAPEGTAGAHNLGPPGEPRVSGGDSAAIDGLSIVDSRTGLPESKLLSHILDAYFNYYGDIYCFMNRNYLNQSIAQGRASTFLIWAIAALSSRFCEPEIFVPYFSPIPEDTKREAWENASPFLEKAKSMVVSAINLPTIDGVAGLLLLAFADFGDNNEAGLWMYTGMALRMAQELGLQRQRSERRPSRQIEDPGETSPQNEVVEPEAFHDSAEIILFWAVFVSDAALCNGTGRVPGLKPHEMNVRLPTSVDVARVRAGPSNRTKVRSAEVYPEMVKIMLQVSQSIDFLNTGASQISHPSNQGLDDRIGRINSLRSNMMQTYRTLPKEVSFGAMPYRAAVEAAQAGPYLLLHLQYHLQIAFLCQESFVEQGVVKFAGQDSNALADRRAKDLYKNSIKAITDLLTIAKLIDDRPTVSLVYLNQAFFHAAAAYVRDMLESKSEESPDALSPAAFPIPSQTSPSMVLPQDELNIPLSNASDTARKSTQGFLALIARANHQFLRQAIKDQHRVYAGSGWVDAVLDQRETGLRDVDLSIVSDSISTFIRLQNLRGPGASEAALQTIVPPGAQGGPPTNNLLDPSNFSWDDFSADNIGNTELNFDPHEFFNAYMSASEQYNIPTWCIMMFRSEPTQIYVAFVGKAKTWNYSQRRKNAVPRGHMPHCRKLIASNGTDCEANGQSEAKSQQRYVLALGESFRLYRVQQETLLPRVYNNMAPVVNSAESAALARRKALTGVSGPAALVKNRKVFGIACFACLGGFVYGYNQGVFSGILTMKVFGRHMGDWVEDQTKKGWLTSIFELGAWMGCLYSGFIAETLSRKYAIVLNVGLFVIGVIVQSCAIVAGYSAILGGRFVTGLAIGAMSVNVPNYNAEVAPPEVRGSLVGLQQLAITAGIMVSFWIDYGTNYIGGTGKTQSEAAWLLPICLQLVPGLALGIGMLFMPFSPRWLLHHGREKEARHVLSSLRGLSEDHELIELEFLEIKSQSVFEKRNIADKWPHLVELKPWNVFKLQFVAIASLFRTKAMFKRVIVATVTMFFQQFTGINAVLYYAPSIFTALGTSSNTTSLLATGVVGVAMFLATVPAVLYIDKLGRKPVMLVGAAGMAACHFIIAAIFGTCYKDWAAHKTAGWAACVFVWLFVVNFGYSWGPCGWIIISEVWPISNRAYGIALGASSNWMSNFIVGQITPDMLESMKYGTFIFFGLLGCVGGFLFIWLVVPETKRLTLEEMDLVFGSKGVAEADAKRQAEINEEIGLTDALRAMGMGKEVDGGVVVETSSEEDEKGGKGHVELVEEGA
ncbi:uncharacterized protein KY384_002421 [Bacidia gigantensis]|uniref:uncharacterized protein n=1 Tax=Bacidia gigantensis TaxID=2732470 RepID=UPI001D04D225|nr:uncharacterized protein KY384_002421 [Bacidia gigantensis]KAG8532544.1 hypothetical protein KY384_002421 [Bacidia gigantensis]